MDTKEKIKYLRESKNWTIRTLAKKAGLSHSTVSHIENGRSRPTSEVIKKLASVFGVTTDYLLGTDEKSTSTLKIQDKKLLEQFRQIDQLDKKDKKAIKTFLDAFLSRKPAKKS